MADTPGVKPTPPPGGAPGAPGGKKAGSWFKQHRAVVLLGGGGAALLLLSHKGSGSGQGSNASSQDQLQAQQDAIAAQEAAALQSGALLPGGTAPVDTGGGAYSTQGPQATGTAPITINVGQPGAPGTGSPNKKKPPANPKPGQVVSGYHNKPGGAPAGYRWTGIGGGRWKLTTVPKPKQAPKTGGKAGKGGGHDTGPDSRHDAAADVHPAARRAVAQHAKTHDVTGHPNKAAGRTKAGAKKKSPAETESVMGFGAGVVVFGREFPGCLRHHVGPPMRAADGSIARKVTLDYGGHSETHLAHGDGSHWTDRVPGMNPPSRGVPYDTGPVPV